MAKNDRKVEIYPKGMEHRFEASLSIVGPDRLAPGPGQWYSNEKEEQVF